MLRITFMNKTDFVNAIGCFKQWIGDVSYMTKGGLKVSGIHKARLYSG